MTAATAARTAMDRLIDPRSIAIIGASRNPAKRGYQAIRALQETGYPHPVYAVNPRGGQVLGVDLLTCIDQLPDRVDVALIAVPARAVPGALRDLAGVVGAAVVLANGFAENGQTGLQHELEQAIADTGIRVVGPNTSGILNAHTGANLVGVPGVPSGPISLVTQSGNMLLSLLADLRALNAEGLDVYVGLGNQADVRYDEVISALARREQTRCIAVHAEGLREGRSLLQVMAHASSTTPVVMLRGGRSKIGQRTALSHTASVAGSDQVATAVLRQAGVELAERSDELAVLADLLAHTPPMAAGTAVAVLSDGGGQATLTADALGRARVPIAALSEHTRGRLRDLLGPAAAVANPVDVAGATDADPSQFAPAARILAADPAVGLVLIVGLYGGYHLRFDPGLEPIEDATSTQLVDLVARTRVPLLVQSCYAIDRPRNHAVLRSGGISVLASIDHCVRSVTALYRRGQRVATAERRSTFQLPHHLRPAPAGPATVVPEPTARQMLAEHGIETGPWVLATTPDQLVDAIAEMGRPCAVKVVSRQVVHKSDVGGVTLAVTPQTARNAWADMHSTVLANVPDARIDGLLTCPMSPVGVELLIGASVDEIFGTVVSFGSGGVYVEALRDITFRAAPFSHLEALEMIDETMVSRMLDGYRHLPLVDRDTLARLLVQVGDAVTAIPDFAELDLNPVIAHGSTITPVDVRLVLTRATS